MAMIDRLARRIAEIERTLRDVAATPQLARSSIVDGAIDQVRTVDTGAVDELGNPVFEEQIVARFGQQGDGGNTVVTFDDPTPPAPTEPTVTPGPGFMVVGWDGRLDGVDSVPTFVRAVGVFVGLATDVIPSPETLRAELPPTGEGTEVTIGSLPAGEYLVSLVAMSHGGRWSEPAPYRVGGPGTSASAVLIEEAIRQAGEASAAAALARNAATEADKRAQEARALADAVSSAANTTDAKAIDALRLADVSLLASDGKTRVTYSVNPPGEARGSFGDTWFQVDPATGVTIGFWECTVGDGGPGTDVPEPTEVVPPAPMFTNRPGISLDEYQIPAAAGVTYLVDSAPKPAGTYTDKTGAVAVAAVAQAGFVFPQSAKVAWVGTLATDGTGYRDPVSASEPVFTDEDGPDNDTVELFPFSPPGGATWRVNGQDVAPGVHPASGSVTVESVPGEMFTFGDAPTSWTHTFDPLRHVTAEPPTFLDRSGTDNDRVTIPASAGVVYRIGTVLRAAGSYPGSGTVTVTAAPEQGYAIDGATSWSFTFSDAVESDIEVTPAAPTFTDLPGVEQDTVTIPETQGVSYLLGGSPVSAGVYPALGTVTVEASPQAGYTLVGDATWTRVFSSARTVVAAAPPGFTDVDGAEQDQVTIPSRTGVVYRLNGVARAAGTYLGEGTATVEAVAASDAYQLTGTTSWTFTFDPLRYVTPAAPTFTDLPGTAQDTVTIPDSAGVTYAVGGTVRAAGSYPASGTVTVTASPASGYAFTTGATTSWSQTLSSARTEVTPAAPTFTDLDGTANDTVTIPSVTGVQYSIGGTPRAAGAYPASGTVTVTAAAASDGYQLASGATTSWTSTFDSKMYVTPAAPTWDDTADTYTIPAPAGVDYYVAGAVKAAGTYTVATGSVLLSTNFDGVADGSRWPEPWQWDAPEGADSKTLVQGGKGILQAGGLANWASKITACAEGLNVADVDITYRLTMNGTETTWHHLMARVPATAAPYPSDGYDLRIQPDSVRILLVQSWSSVTLANVAGTFTRGVEHKVRFQVQGVNLRGKVWPAAQAEPSAWLVEATDTTFATGFAGLQIVGGGTVGPYTHTIDDIVLAAPGGGQTQTITVTAQPRPGYAFPAGATTSWSHTFS